MVVGNKLAPNREQDLAKIAIHIQPHERGAREAARQYQPARQLGGQSRLALAAFALDHHVALARQQPLGREQLAAAALELVRWRRRSIAQSQRSALFGDRPDFLRWQLADELRVLFLLEEHGHEPVLETQLDIEHPAAHRIARERPLRH